MSSNLENIKKQTIHQEKLRTLNEKSQEKSNQNVPEDDFWGDCCVENTDTTKNNEKETEKENFYHPIEKISNFPSKIMSKSNSTVSLQNSLIDQKVIHLVEKYGEEIIKPELDPENQKIIQRRLKADNRCKQLYEKAKLKNKVNQVISVKTKELKLKDELSKCTFKPKTNVKEYSHIKQNKNKIYDRNVQFKMNALEKIKKIKLEQNEHWNVTFKPEFVSKLKKEEFNPENNVINDFHARNYMFRQESARRQKNELKTISPDRKMVKSSSIGNLKKGFNESIMHLHENLNNFEINL